MNDDFEMNSSEDSSPSGSLNPSTVTRRNAMSIMAKYGAATAPVMMTLFHGTDASATVGRGSGGTVRRRRRRRRRKR